MAALAVLIAACESTTRPIEPPPETVDDCARCHGNPPPPPHTASTQCSVCHPDTVLPDNVTLVPGGAHQNGVVDVASGHPIPFVAEHTPAALADIASCATCHGADYAGGTSGESCNACHAGIAASAPDWKANCSFCHGARTAGVTTETPLAAPPQAVVGDGDQTRTNPKVGAHQAHLVQGSVANAQPCAACHAVPGSAEALTHFAGWANGTADVAFSTLAAKGVTGAAYSGGACSVYCHGSGTEFTNPAGKVSPAWTSAGVTCTTCHGAPPASGPTVSDQDAHAFHAGQGAGCATCHPVPPGQLASHVNGTKDVVANGTVIAGWNCNTCHTALGVPLMHALPFVAAHPAAALASISGCADCHGADYAGGTTGVSCNGCHAGIAASAPDWKANCSFCHGTRTASVTGATPLAAPPEAVAGATAPTDPKVGAHQAHLAQGTVANAQPCASCHAVPAPAQALAHFDGWDGGTADLAFSALATQGVASPGYAGAGGSCAVYCHGSGTEFANPAGWASPAWTTASITCTDCHGVPPASGPAIGSGANPPNAHAFHASAGATCATCHPVPPGQLDSHVNGAKDVVANGTAITGWDCTTCHDALGVGHALPFVAQHTTAALADIASCTSCHGADYGGGTAQSCNACHSSIATSAPDWKQNCSFCHGTRTAGVTSATALAAPPQAVAGATSPTDPRVGAHQAHLQAGPYAAAFPCATCHVPPGGAQALSHFTGGTATLAFGALASQGVASPAYAGGSCTVYCHGTGTSWPTGSVAANRLPPWTSSGLACNACHASRPATGRHTNIARHAAAPCTFCHLGYVQDTTVVPSLHVDGVKSVVFTNNSGGTTQITTGWTDCNNCHDQNANKR